ncbi:probable Tfp pilus assembly protein, tip-associated adhesin PilY1 [gamma proteobacterium HdN1]|nr:probable Tfp pilus assembly protein, tip-associated adhesin PilY1 [gamma proteobacterium HdN1]
MTMKRILQRGLVVATLGIIAPNGVSAASEYDALCLTPPQNMAPRTNEASIDRTGFGSAATVRYSGQGHEPFVVEWSGGSDGFLRGIESDSGRTVAKVPLSGQRPSTTELASEAMARAVLWPDSHWMALQSDVNKDGVIQRADGDWAYLFGGMRRAGRSVFGFDISNPVSPDLLFELTGATNPEYEQLAQTWSGPSVVRLRLQSRGAAEPVLVFGGGYDGRYDLPSTQDNVEGRTGHCVAETDRCGAAIYFVKASGSDAGKLLWTITGDGALDQEERRGERRGDPIDRFSAVPALRSPIVAGVKSVDLNSDGIADALYAIDVDGRVFRITPASQSRALDVALIAELGNIAQESSSDTGWDTRFFFDPSVAVLPLPMGKKAVILAVGSGTIVQPFQRSQKGILYLLRDDPALEVQRPVTPASDGAQWLRQGLANFDAKARLTIVPLELRGEKLFAPPLVVDYKAFFKTWAPRQSDSKMESETSSSGDGCSGISRIWGIDLLSGRPVFDASGSIDAVGASAYAVQSEAQAFARLDLVAQSCGKHGRTCFSLSDGLHQYSFPPSLTAPHKMRWRQLPSATAF